MASDIDAIVAQNLQQTSARGYQAVAAAGCIRQAVELAPHGRFQALHVAPWQLKRGRQSVLLASWTVIERTDGRTAV